MAATGGTAAAAAAAIAEAEVVVTTTMTTNKMTTAAARGRQQQSTIGHSWISTAFAICLDFNIDLTVSQSQSDIVEFVTRRGWARFETEKFIFIQNSFFSDKGNNK